MIIDKREAWLVPQNTIKCNKCKKTYIPNKECISVKNPSYYYKTCLKCRDYFKEYLSTRNHLHYSNYQPSMFQ